MKSHVDSDASLRRLASAIALGVAALLIGAKLWGWMATDSVALLTSAADAVVDALAATATTTPSGLTVNFTYNGSSTVPTAAGSYTVVGTISDSNYSRRSLWVF